MGGTAIDAVYLFDALKYFKDTGEMHVISTPGGSAQFAGVAPMIQPYSDGSDAMANLKASVVGFEHVGTNSFVAFKAYITNFTETYASDWNTEVIFGRHDPVYGYKNTQRSISFGWKMPAASLSEGIENLARLQAFLKMLYPGYDVTYLDGRSPVSHLVQAPHIRMQFMNMIARYDSNDPGFNIKRASGRGSIRPDNEARNFVGLGGPVQAPAAAGPSVSYGKQSIGRGGITGGTPTGLLGAITSVTINHNLDGDVGVFQGQGAIIPKLIEIDITFAPLHEIPLGWDETGRDSATGNMSFSHGASAWPYGVNDGAIAAKSGHGNAGGLTQEEIDNLIVSQREFRDKEADVLNAQARYNGLFGRSLARFDATACATGRCKGHRASAARGAEEYFNRRASSETRRRQSGGNNRTNTEYRPWNDGFGTNPTQDYKTARDIREARNRRQNRNRKK
tara:strand:+ start:1 stop:1353 length:1353 start_codon:yes stop_codon:yes gene_type:complete